MMGDYCLKWLWVELGERLKVGNIGLKDLG